MIAHRLFAAAFATIALVTSTTAREFRDAERRFHLIAPDGWAEMPSPGEPIALVLGSPRFDVTRGNCNIFVGKNELSGKSQGEVDKTANDIVNNEAFWKASISSVPILKSTTIDTFGSRDVDGRKVFFVKATSDAESNGAKFKVTQLQDMHPTPGMTYTVTCTALTDKFSAEEKDFASIMTSLTPSVGALVTWMTVPANVAAARENVQQASRSGMTMGVSRLLGRR